MSTGLNETESKNRLRFQKLSHRLKKIHVDVVHRIRADGAIDKISSVTPETGIKGCFFQDELENCKDLITSSTFKRFYYDMWPLVQSQAELVHHLPTVISKLDNAITTAEVSDKVVFVQLLCVLTRDVNEELYAHFHKIMSTLIKQVEPMAHNLNGGAPTPEVCAKLFECISLLIK
jgi:hypothetical protein